MDTILLPMRKIVLFFIFLLGVWLTACELFPGSDSGNNTPITQPQPTATISNPLPQSTPDLTAPQIITQTRKTLTVWIPTDFAAADGKTAVLVQQIRSFADIQAEVDVKIEFKSINGQGSILNYLRTGKTVAPSILPDLIALPTSQLETAVTDALIAPIDDLIDSETFAALYPAAQTHAKLNGQLIGYPFAITGLSHLSYDNSVITRTIGSSWESLRTNPNILFAYPANSFEGATLLLQMYRDAGGTLTNDAGQIELQVEPLARSLEQLNLARNEGILARQSSSLSSQDGAWQIGQSSAANMIVINAAFFLKNRSDAITTAVAPVPAINNPVTPLVGSWVWAISTNNPSQRALAADLLTTLISADNMAEWSLQTGHLPARQDAFALWPDDDPYITFLQQQLDIAQAHPLNPNSTVIAALKDAAFNVITLTDTPQVAAEKAVSAVTP
jgi:maltose-binding protein MalE